MNQAWLFPGQGSQYPGMGRGLWERYSEAQVIAEEAEALSGLPLRQIGLLGPIERLRRCDVLEPLLTAISLSYAEILRGHGLVPSFVAGYSAGEIAALGCAGVVSRTDALRIAILRGRLLQGAAEALSGRMVAAYRIPASAVTSVITELESVGTIAIAAWNAPDHTTIVGDEALVRHAEAELLALDAETAAIDVAGPWHCRLLDRVAGEALRHFEAIRFRPPVVPVYTSASGRIESAPDRLRQCLADQLCVPVLWQAILEDLRRRGVRSFLEVGPGRVLSGLLRRAWTDPEPYEIRTTEGRTGGTKPLEKLINRDRSSVPRKSLTNCTGASDYYA
jgi:[acyl-carrier-protein] S-malonyltransferase